MESTDNDAEEEEEIIVYANFEEGTVDRDLFQNSNLKFKVIGLDSDSPIVQLGDQTFKGTWSDTIGTRVFLEEDPSPEQVDPVFTILPPKMLKYKCMSTKTLDLSRVFLKPKFTEEVKNKNDVHTSISADKSADEKLEDEILNLAHNTINPDSNTSQIMSEIVAESMMDDTE